MILTHAYCFPSARALRNAIQRKTGRRFLVTSHPEKIKDLTLRYGNSQRVYVKDTDFNSPSFINLAASKREFSNLLSRNGFYTPVYYREDPSDSHFPLIIRQTLYGTGGKGIIVCRNINEFRKNWTSSCYWTHFVHTSDEYRAHVLGGQIKKIQKKVRESDEKEEFPIRNMDRGYHFSLRSEEGKFEKLRELVSRLTEVLHGHFYSLDVGYDKLKKEYFIFEANSASGLNDNTADLYADYLIKELKL